METLTDPGRIIIPRVTDLQSFEYAKVYERLKEYENAIDAEEFITFKHAKEHSLLPELQHIIIAKVFNGTAKVFYERKEESEFKLYVQDERGTNLVSMLGKLLDNTCRIEQVRYLEDYK